MLALTPSARFIDGQQIRILAVEQNVLGTANTVFFFDPDGHGVRTQVNNR